MERRCEKEAHLKPNTVAYKLMHQKKIASMVQQKKQRPFYKNHQRGDADVKPNTISFTSIIDAWACSGDGKPIFSFF
jgi:hypothetical protein